MLHLSMRYLIVMLTGLLILPGNLEAGLDASKDVFEAISTGEHSVPQRSSGPHIQREGAKIH